MALTDTQVRQLRAKLEAKYVKTRKANGADLHYVEGWHVIAEANRIFGYDAWDRRTLASHCVWSGPSGPYHGAAYIAKVRVSVRARDILIVREGSGTGEGKAATPGQAHDLALKGAETDATKRALATFGNPFGLALYDREQVGVRKTRGVPASLVSRLQTGPWVLRSRVGALIASHYKPKDFVEALRRAMSDAHDIELLYDLWEQNIETLRTLHRSINDRPGIVPVLVGHLRACAIALVKRASKAGAHPASEWNGGMRPRIDKSALTISEPKRIRCKEHLRFVASQPCLICGRSPAHAHHVRFAQSRGLSLKVSDEFTVPLCATHHHDIHTTGKEREWWQERNIDPLKIASGLWQQSRQRHPAREADVPESSENRADGSSKGARGSDYGSKPIAVPASAPDPIDNGNGEL